MSTISKKLMESIVQDHGADTRAARVNPLNRNIQGTSIVNGRYMEAVKYIEIFMPLNKRLWDYRMRGRCNLGFYSDTT